MSSNVCHDVIEFEFMSPTLNFLHIKKFIHYIFLLYSDMIPGVNKIGGKFIQKKLRLYL